MSETPPKSSEEILKLTAPRPGSEVFFPEHNLSLYSVKNNIIQRIQKAENLEIAKLLKELDDLQCQIDKEIEEKFTLAKLDAIQKESSLARKITITNLVIKITSSGIGCGIGVYLIVTGNPFIGPLILIISLATSLNIPINEISTLLAQLTKESQVTHLEIEKPDKAQKEKISQQYLIAFYLLFLTFILILILVFANTEINIKQALIVIIGLLLIFALDLFKKNAG